ncbi:MAG TPA: hypothetical protein V6D17_14200 [Candidatus Obscuribacterales bacterium]
MSPKFACIALAMTIWMSATSALADDPPSVPAGPGASPAGTSTKEASGALPGAAGGGATAPGGSNQPGATAGDQTLKGRVHGGTANALAGLRDLGVTCHHLEDALKGMLYEVQRQDMVVVAEPDVIGPMVIPALPDPSGMMSMGYLPPRPKYVNFFLLQIDNLIPMLQSELTALSKPDITSPEMASLFNDLTEEARTLAANRQALEAVARAPQLKNMEIGLKATVLYEQVGKINKLRKRLFHLVKEQSKKSV